MRRSSIPFLLVVAALLGACANVTGTGSGGDTPSVQSPLGPPPPTGSPTGEKPEVRVPDGPPPEELVVDDLREGTGAAAKSGDTMVVHYVGVAYSTGEEFDASWDGGQPFPVVIGTGQVIPGWDRGLIGMKAGGRRQLIIPPELAYGAEGIPAAGIGPNETLIFVVDLIELT